MTMSRARCDDCKRFLKDAEPIVGVLRTAWGGGPYIAGATGTCARHGLVETKDCAGWDDWFGPDTWIECTQTPENRVNQDHSGRNDG